MTWTNSLETCNIRPLLFYNREIIKERHLPQGKQTTSSPLIPGGSLTPLTSARCVQLELPQSRELSSLHTHAGSHTLITSLTNSALILQSLKWEFVQVNPLGTLHPGDARTRLAWDWTGMRNGFPLPKVLLTCFAADKFPCTQAHTGITNIKNLLFLSIYPSIHLASHYCKFHWNNDNH